MLLTHDRTLVPRGLRLPEGARLPDPGAAVRIDCACFELSHPDGSRERWFLDGPGQDLFVPVRGQQPAAPRPALVMDALPARTRALLGVAPEARLCPDIEARPTFAELELDRLRALLEELTAGLRGLTHGHEVCLEEAVDGLLGLGSGSTPSGDDVLAGAAAAARTLGLPGARRLGEALTDLSPDATTAAGRAMLREAAAGFFVLPLSTLAGAWPAAGRSTIEALIGVGASSGADMLAGFLAQTEALYA
ncbi:MAG: DUF2877 domain-containing protein [Myxococcales bacterium]|nr:DUF2877 domain-containing protein [Myxococcales bacterium]